MGELLKEMGQRILDRRKQLKLTQEALAKMAHVTPQTVSTAELGTKAMRPETMLKICDALDISTDYLLRGRRSPPKCAAAVRARPSGLPDADSRSPVPSR